MSLYLGNQQIAGISTPVQGRVIGQIIQSTIPLVDAGLHLADGSLIDGNGIYKDFYDYMMSGYENGIRISGSLTNNNGVFSEFSISGFLYIPGVRTNNNVEYVFKITTGSDISTQQAIVHSEHLLCIEVGGGNIYTWDWTVSEAKTILSVSTNTTYWIKVNINNSSVIYSTSTDGTSFTQRVSYTDTNIVVNDNYQFRLGLASQEDIHPFLGSIDVKGCYIKLNNELLWDGSQYSILPGRYIDETRYQEYMTNYGVCGKYAISYKDKTIRLPYITGIIEGTLNSNHIGNVTAAGLPNITGSINRPGQNNTSGDSTTNYLTGSFYFDSNTYSRRNTSESGTGYLLKFDASRSSSIYGNSDTVQPQTVKVYYYIVIATLTKTDIEVDIDEIATDLNNKVDKSDLIESHVIIESYVNGTSWYRIWSDGWIEQGGKYTYSSAGQKTISLLKSIDITRPVYFSYKLVTTRSAGAYERECNVNSYTSSNFVVYTSTSNGSQAFWEAKGYIL